MDISDIIYNSFKYPFKDFKKFLFVCIFFILLIIPGFSLMVLDKNILLISLIFPLIFLLIMPGYTVSIIKEGCNQSNSVPSFNLKRNILNTLKLFLLNIVYGLIPMFVLIICVIATGLFALPFNTQFLTLNSLINAVIIIELIIIIVNVIVSIFYSIALARFAKYDKLSEGFSIRSIFKDIKKIGFGKTIIWYIVMGIFTFLITIFCLFLLFIPYVGLIIYLVFVLPYISIVYNYSLGLLYNNGDDCYDEYDFDEFEKELRILKYGLHG